MLRSGETSTQQFPLAIATAMLSANYVKSTINSITEIGLDVYYAISGNNEEAGRGKFIRTSHGWNSFGTVRCKLKSSSATACCLANGVTHCIGLL